LEAEYAGKCAVLISHRLSNVVAAKQILVLEQGLIIERGTHAELMSRSGRYAQLFSLQAQKYSISAS
jgi:ATP-binding cassette subfamily B protein